MKKNLGKCGHIYQDFIIIHYYIAFYHFNNS